MQLETTDLTFLIFSAVQVTKSKKQINVHNKEEDKEMIR